MLFRSWVGVVLGSGVPGAVLAVRRNPRRREGGTDACCSTGLCQADFPSHLGLACLQFRPLRFMAAVTF